MASGPRYAVRFRRKREGSTNYKRRLALLKSKKPRLVIRKSNKYIICQIIDYNESGDKVLASVNSISLKKLGWKHGCNNLPASYLTGFMLGLVAKKAKVKEAILDYGLYTTTKSSRIYTAMKGSIDAGLNVPHGKEDQTLPSEERISGKHINEKIGKDFATLKSKMK